MRTRISFLPIALLLATTSVALAQSPVSSSHLYSLNFKDVEIVTLAEAVASASGKQIVLHPQVHGLVTLMSVQPLSASESYSAFGQALALKGYVVEETGGVVKVYPGRVKD
jgi:general secretion pathway protein D